MQSYPSWPFQAFPTKGAVIQTNQTGWIEWDVTADVAAFLAGSVPNNGWIVRKLNTAAGQADFSSREGANAPQLVITPGAPPPPVQPGPVLTSSGDTFLTSGAANANHGYDTVMTVQSGGSNRALIHMDQAAIVSYTGSGILQSAKLRLYIASNGNNWGSAGRTVNVHRITQAWMEPTATWNCPNDTNPINSAKDCAPDWQMGQSAQWPFAAPASGILHSNNQTGWVEWDVTSDVAAFLSGTVNNHGWIIRKDDESVTGQVDYSTREGANPPQLVLTVIPHVSVSITPSAASLSISQAQQFTAAVTGTGNTAVTWSINPNVGAINATGLYTAPAAIAAQQTVTVTATSVVDPGKSASAGVTLTPVAVSVNPGSASLGVNDAQQFTATVTGSANTGVAWSISPGVGAVDGAGLYTAPATIAVSQTVTVTATSLADPAKSASAAVTLVPSTTTSLSDPTFNPPGGAYTTAQAITISSPGASIRYTTDGSTPSDTVGFLYTGPVALSAVTTLKAIAYLSGSANSNVMTAIYYIGTPPSITSRTPATGAAGTQVTINGTGFGATQGSGAVIVGSMNALITSWTDTQIVATVASGSVSGVVRIQQNALWSNALTFTVPGGGNSLAPNVISMVVGDTRNLQALNTNGQPATGLTWTSSDTNIVSLSTDDPPLLTALAPGHVTITVGAASADITVYLDSLPIGTPIWSNPGNGSGVSKIVPAVPSATGVADVFAFSGNGTVQAITSDGFTAWTANVSQALPNNGLILPDFQGGLVIAAWDSAGNSEIKRFDGITGTAWSYVVDSDSYWVWANVHTDGTIFAHLQRRVGNVYESSVVGINSTTGTEKFRMTVPGDAGRTDMIIAGDGYAYLPYTTGATATSVQVKLLRVSSGGAYTVIDIGTATGGVGFPVSYRSYPVLISNGDDGVLLSWTSYPPATPPNTGVPHLTKVSSTGVSDAIGPDIPGRADYSVVPLIQREDGTFVGTIFAGPHQSDLFDWVPHMVAFDANGTVLWDVPNEQPMIATEGNGVIGWKGTVYDQNGNAIGVSPLKDYITFDQNGNVTGREAVAVSWTGNAYRVGSVTQFLMDPTYVALSFTAFQRGNQSGNGTAVKNPWFAPLKICPGAATPCPREAIMSALKALRTLVQSPCPACDSWVFNKLPGTNQASFREFLSRPPLLLDGTRSYAPQNVAFCPSGLLNQASCGYPSCLLSFGCPTVRDYFLQEPGRGAAAQTPASQGKGMQVFFNPAIGICNVLSVPNPPSLDKGVLNQAVLFHEALHGYTGRPDVNLQSAFGLETLPAPSVNITYYLEGKTIPGGAQGAAACEN